MDDLLLYSKSIDEHKALLNSLFTLLDKNKLYVKSEKCALFLETVALLGHTVSSQGLHVEQGKIHAVGDWPVPTALVEL